MDGLNNLLDNGFSTSVYLYNVNFESSPKYLVNNKSNDTLKYFQLGGNNSSELDSILMFTYNSIMNYDVEATCVFTLLERMASIRICVTVLLKQFCGYSTEKALRYWEDCADNWTRGYDRIRKRN